MPALHHLLAPAKINLFLHVVGRRPDGYHLLQSVFALVDWCDTLHLDTRADGHIARHDLGQALPAEDLCLKAARLLQARSGSALGCDIHIDKVLPSGAGLGGGSSDAATVLLGLNRLWGLHWPGTQLATLALELGADVPFFVHGHNAWVEGVGERITPLALPATLLATPLVLLKPQASIPTPAMFGSPLLRRDTPAATADAFLADPLHFGHNDLQAPAQAHAPDVTLALQALQDAHGNARMTGSGSAVFAWDEGPGHARPALVGQLPHLAEKMGWVIQKTHLLRHHPVLDFFDANPGDLTRR
jgi:4-diphosphocytidyl-2-C-methyl-D-erythritol kinase